MKVSIPVFGLIFIALCSCSPSARAATSTGTSPSFVLDLEVGNLTVQGRVVAAASRQPISGATVTLAGLNTSSGGDGRFTFNNVSLALGNELVAGKSGYANSSVYVAAPAGATSVSLSDVLLSTGTGPVITHVDKRYPGALFLYGVPLLERYTARVNWNGHTPGSVVFRADGTTLATLTGAGPEYSHEFDVSSIFRPAYAPLANTLSITATDASGIYTTTTEHHISVIPTPTALAIWLGLMIADPSYDDVQIALDFSFPKPGIKQVLDLPVLGKFGFEFAANASFDYTISDGEFEAMFGVGAGGKQGKRGRRPTIPGLTRYPKAKVYIGNKEIGGKLMAGVRGNATLAQGIQFNEGVGTLEIHAKLELGRVGLLDLLGPGLSTWAAQVPGLSEVLKNISIIIYVIPGIDGEVTFALEPVFEPKELEATGKIGIEAAYEPDIGIGSMSLYVGGEPSVTLGLPEPLFRNLRFRAYAGIDVEVWVFGFSTEYVFLDVQYPEAVGAASKLSLMDAGTVKLFAVRNPREWRPVARRHLDRGMEGFALGGRHTKAMTDDLDRFRLMGQAPTRGAVGTGKAVATKTTTFSAPSQADLALVTNVFPKGSPAMAERGSELMLLYVGDNGDSNALQCTDIRWTHWDGANWSAPQSLHTNTQAEFSPQVAFDGNGDAVAVWERIADPNFTNADLTAMAAEMEVVWSRWDQTSGTWTTPSALTTNDVLDHKPLLAGPMADGSLLATWRRNEANVLMGTNGAPDEVMWSRWDAGSQSWSSEQLLLTGVVHGLSQSLAGATDRAVYLWSADADGVLTNQADQQVYRIERTGGAWGAPMAVTADAASNRNARVVISPAGEAFAIWQQGGDLVMSRNFTGDTTVVRADSQTAGFTDFAMTLGPAGNLVLLWQEMTENGSDAHYMAYDPLSQTWSRDELLVEDESLERSFAPVWDNLGNLTVAYNKVEMLRVDKTVELEAGGFVTITNVLQPGQVDLYVTKRALIRDLAIRDGDFAAEGLNFLPGDAVTLTATYRNEGDVAATNVLVEFFEGDPAGGGVLIGAVTNGGWFEGAATGTVSALWVVPEPATNRVLYATVNRTGAATEFNSSNNLQSLAVGGVDVEGIEKGSVPYSSNNFLR